ncbi:MAG: hypothetical protein GY861_05800 [bacterium]|nr:hypothetical protein [bacterium]
MRSATEIKQEVIQQLSIIEQAGEKLMDIISTLQDNVMPNEPDREEDSISNAIDAINRTQGLSVEKKYALISDLVNRI